MVFQFAYLDLSSDNSKGQDQAISTLNISEMVTDMNNITNIISNMKSNKGFRLAHLFTFDHGPL